MRFANCRLLSLAPDLRRQVRSDFNFHFLFPPCLPLLGAPASYTPPLFPGTSDVALPSRELPFSRANPSIEVLPSSFPPALLLRSSRRPVPLPHVPATATLLNSPGL